MVRNEHLRAELSRLRQDVAALKQQVHRLEQQLEESRTRPASGFASRTQLSRRVNALYKQLPPRFTVEDLISISEQIDINVFQAYQDLQMLILNGRVVQHDDLFVKQNASSTGAPGAPTCGEPSYGY